MPNDIMLDGNGDLEISDSGDFIIGESTQQHQNCLLLAQKGDYRQFPNIGVGINDFIQDDNLADLPEVIQQQYELDGMTIQKLNVFENGEIEIQAEYD